MEVKKSVRVITEGGGGRQRSVAGEDRSLPRRRWERRGSSRCSVLRNPPRIAASSLSGGRDLFFPSHSSSVRVSVMESVVMETCSRILNFDQISFNNILCCASELKCNEQGAVHLPPVSAPREVICPEPRRSTRVPYMLDNLNRPNCKAKRNLPSHRGGPSVDIFGLVFATDDMVDELDTGSSRMDLLSCSPPVRTENPLVHDLQFTRQTPILDTPSVNTLGGKHAQAREGGAHARGTATAEKPMVRIEGFACRDSKSQCVSALA